MTDFKFVPVNSRSHPVSASVHANTIPNRLIQFNLFFSPYSVNTVTNRGEKKSKGLLNNLYVDLTSPVKSKPPAAVVTTAAPSVTTAKKTIALVIGIEYIQYASTGQLDQLPGCIYDTSVIVNLLTNRLGVNKSDITVMTDNLDPSSPLYPSKANMETQLLNLLASVQATKEAVDVWITYSGHGSRVEATNAGEEDGKNSVIVPADFLDNGFITNYYIVTQFLEKLPSTTNVNIVFDCCNSGTTADLQYVFSSYNSTGVKENNNKVSANVFYLSGCRDTQESESVEVDSKSKSAAKSINRALQHYCPISRQLVWRGALTYAFQSTLESANVGSSRKIKANTMLRSIQNFLSSKGYDQNPEISLSKNVPLSAVYFPL